MISRSHWGRRATVAPGGSSTFAALASSRLGRSLAAHPHWTAAGLIAVPVLAYLWPALLLGRPLLPAALIFAGAPWHAGAGTDYLQYANIELGDVPISYYPWDVLARQLLHAGTFPAWNAHALAGTPFFANAQVAWLSPFSLPLWVLPLPYGLGVAAALKLWAAGFGTYLLVRELRLGFWPALLAAVSFMLCAFNVLWLTYGVFLSVAALLPWCLWLAERLIRHGRSRDGLWLALVVFVVLTGGHPGTQVHVLAAVALFASMRAALVGDRTRPQRLRSLGLVVAGLAVGALLAAVVLLPAQRAAAGTLGELVRRNGAATLPGTHVPFGSLRTALFPEWWGRPVEHIYGGGSRFRERTFYAGVIPFVLAVLALVSPGGWRRKAPFAVLGALGAAIAVRAPGIYDATIQLPLFDRVQNQRILLWFVFATAILGAFGLETALRASGRQRARGVLAGAVVVGLVVAATQMDGDALSKAPGYVFNRGPGARPETLALASVLWWTLVVILLAAILSLAWRRVPRVALAGALVVALVALDLLRFSAGYNPMGPASTVMPPRTPAISYLQRHVGDGRIAGIGPSSLPPDWSTLYGLDDVRGYDAPQPSLRFAQLWAMMVEPTGEPARVSNLTPSGVELFGMLGARYVVVDPGTTSPFPSLAVVYKGRDATIFANRAALPRALVVGSVEVVDSEQSELEAVASPTFDPRAQAVVRQDELGRTPPPNGGSGDVRIVGEGNAHVTLEASLDRAGLVVLTDQYAPGWSVRVDGRPAPALRTNVVLRGVVVPAGRHRVEWRYSVPGLWLGAALSGIGLVLALAWAAVLAGRARRVSRPSVRRSVFCLFSVF